MPTPVIRILLAGGRTTNVEHSHQNTISGREPSKWNTMQLRKLLAGGGTTTVEHNAIRIFQAVGERPFRKVP